MASRSSRRGGPGSNELLIRLPARGAAGDAFSVRFVYEVPSPHPGQRLGWRGTLHLQPPRSPASRRCRAAGRSTCRKTIATSASRARCAKPSSGAAGICSARGSISSSRKWARCRPAPASPVQAEPPELPAPKTAGFNTQLQREGVAVTLRRLGEPAAVGVVYRGRGYTATVEAIAFLLSLAGGIALLGHSRPVEFLYFMVVGVGALIIAGAVSPRSAGFWQAIYLGAFLSVIIWFVCGTMRGIAGWRIWKRRPPQPPPGWNPPHEPPSPQPPAPPEPPAEAPPAASEVVVEETPPPTGTRARAITFVAQVAERATGGSRQLATIGFTDSPPAAPCLTGKIQSARSTLQIGVGAGMLLPAPPSEPDWRNYRIRLSSQQFAP